jgi:hypothetical protein
MNFSHYLGLVKSEKVEQFIFAQGNRPAAKLDDGQTRLLSEVFLFKEDLESIQKEILELSGPNYTNKTFYLEGARFKFEALNLSDSITICIKQIHTRDWDWKNFLTPGYVQDWIESGAGLVVFYGSDADLVEEVRLSFAEQRIQRIAGKSLVFSSGPALDEVSDGQHFITSSSDESGFLEKLNESPKFDAYFFKSDIKTIGGENLVRLSDRGAFVAFNSFWRDIDAVWTDLMSSLGDEFYKDFVLKSIIGFVGVRAATSSEGKRSVVFEAIPVASLQELSELKKADQIKSLSNLLKTQGVSFNQSLHSLVLKRQISIESAYATSSNPEELNEFLSDSGM